MLYGYAYERQLERNREYARRNREALNLYHKRLRKKYPHYKKRHYKRQIELHGKEEHNRKNRDWYNKNKDKVCFKVREFYHKNKDQIIRKRRIYRLRKKIFNTIQ